jgi:hypothetical protein
MSEKTPQNETSKAVMEAFTFIRCQDETLNERVHAMASLLHTASMMVIKSESRKGEGFECIKYLELAFMYYQNAQFRKRFDEPEKEKDNQPLLFTP